MEDNTELLEKYIEEGKLPLKGELFSRKAKIAEKLRLHREESRRITVSRQRKRGGERSAALYWGIVAMFIVLLGNRWLLFLRGKTSNGNYGNGL